MVKRLVDKMSQLQLGDVADDISQLLSDRGVQPTHEVVPARAARTDEEGAAFRDRALDHTQDVAVAGGHAGGHNHRPGHHPAVDAGVEVFWTAFLRALRTRGLA